MKDKKEVKYITKSCEAFLEETDGVKLPIGEVRAMRAEPGPTVDDMADAAFSAARNSLRKLMPHRYKVVVIFEGCESRFGLDRWIKLRDGSKDNRADAKGKKKQPIHRHGVATKEAA